MSINDAKPQPVEVRMTTRVVPGQYNEFIFTSQNGGEYLGKVVLDFGNPAVVMQMLSMVASAVSASVQKVAPVPAGALSLLDKLKRP